MVLNVGAACSRDDRFRGCKPLPQESSIRPALFLPTVGRQLPGIGEQMTLLGGYFFTAAAAIERFDFKITGSRHLLQLLHLRLWRNRAAAGFTGRKLDGPDRAF